MGVGRTSQWIWTVWTRRKQQSLCAGSCRLQSWKAGRFVSHEQQLRDMICWLSACSRLPLFWLVAADCNSDAAVTHVAYLLKQPCACPDWEDEGVSASRAACTAGRSAWSPLDRICVDHPSCLQATSFTHFAVCGASEFSIINLPCRSSMLNLECPSFCTDMNVLHCRGLRARRMLREAKRAATRVAAAWRGHAARRQARQLRKETAATRIAAAWRCHKARKAFNAYKV